MSPVRSVSDRGQESFLVVVGLDEGDTTSQRVCHISLERPDWVSTIDSTPAWVDEGAAACVMGNTCSLSELVVHATNCGNGTRRLIGRNVRT